MTERPDADLDDPRDAGLPRGQRLVLRRRSTSSSTSARSRSSRPTRSPASPTTCSRCCPACASTPARAAAAAASSSGCTRAPGSATSPSTSRWRSQQVVGHDIRRGKTRQVKGEPGRYNVIYGYVDEQVGLAAGRLAVRLVNHLVQADPEFDWDAELEAFILRAERTAFGPSTQAILDEAVSRDIPWIRLNQYSLVQLGQGVHAKRIRATMTSATSADRGRHRLRQGPHHPAARRRRPAGAQAGVGAHRRPGRAAVAERIGYPVVVKPLDGNHGRGVCLDLQNEDDVREAFPIAEEQSRRGLVIVESFVTGKDYRCLIIDGRIAAIAERVPATSIGDGAATVERARRHHQRRPAPRRRPREGADPDQGRRRGRRAGRASRATRSTTCRPRARWSSSR